MSRARASALLLVCALAPLLGACSSSEGLGERHARDDADEQAAVVGDQLERGSRGSDDLSGVIGTALSGSDVDLLTFAGDLADRGSRPHVEVRVTGRTDGHSSGGIGDETWPATTVVRCYRFSLGNDRYLSHTPQHVRRDCAERAAIPVPDPPAVVNLTEDDQEFLRGLLDDPYRDVSASLSERFPEGVNVDVAEVEGTVGVGLLALDPGRDCLLGRRAADGTVEVWFPPSITVAPGEASCSASTAAAGGAQRDPH